MKKYWLLLFKGCYGSKKCQVLWKHSVLYQNPPRHKTYFTIPVPLCSLHGCQLTCLAAHSTSLLLMGCNKHRHIHILAQCIHTYTNKHTDTHTYIHVAIVLSGHLLSLSVLSSCLCKPVQGTLSSPSAQDSYWSQGQIGPPFLRIWEWGKGQKACVYLSHQ